jgi:acetylornithine deacetylase/succinyl-diaminopimelate desuccinylase-like protein
MVAAFEALVRSGHQTNGVLTLTSVACEETRGHGTKAVVESGLKAEAAVIGEPTGLEVHIAHKGVVRLEIRTTGRSAHASRPEEGANAVTAMADVVRQLARLSARVSRLKNPLLGHASLTVTKIDGGEAENVVPERCRVGVDRRLLPGEDLDRVVEQIWQVARAACRRHAGVTVETVATHGMASPETAPDHPIVTHALKCREAVTGHPSVPAGFPACCDMVYLSSRGIPTVILGPGELAQAHVADEHVNFGQVAQAAEIYALLAVDWLDRESG